MDEEADPEQYLHRDDLFNWRAYRIATREQAGLVGGDGVDSKGLVMGMRKWERGSQDEVDGCDISPVEVVAIDGVDQMDGVVEENVEVEDGEINESLGSKRSLDGEDVLMDDIKKPRIDQ
jgi:hypothetical protein